VVQPVSESRPECPIDPLKAHQELVEAIVEVDEDLMALYFEGEEPSAEQIASGVTTAMEAGRIIPVMFVSATTSVGLDALMDALSDLVPSPAVVVHHATDAEGNDVVLTPQDDGPFLGQVFKT